MFSNIPFGRFFPNDSFLHQLDARFKMIAVISLMIVLFAAKGWGYVILAAATIVAVLLSRIPLMAVWSGLRGFVVLILISAVINLFLTPGAPMYRLGPLTITDQGLHMSVVITVRLLLLLVIGMLLTWTTDPLDLTEGLESMLSPLKRFGFPAHELAMMMTIALRFIPTLGEEADKIIKAQMARGAEFGHGSLMQRSRALLPVVVPLFVSVFRRADELALAMEARAYRGGRGRTRLKQLRAGWRDAVAAGVVVLIILGVLGAR